MFPEKEHYNMISGSESDCRLALLTRQSLLSRIAGWVGKKKEKGGYIGGCWIKPYGKYDGECKAFHHLRFQELTL